MKNYVICRTSDKTGAIELYGPYEKFRGDEIIRLREDRDKYAYYLKILRHPVDLEETK